MRSRGDPANLVPVTSTRVRRARLRALPRRTLAAMRHHDLLLYGAGVTFYAALAVVPGLLVATRLLALAIGPSRVLALSADLAAALPDQLGADKVATALLREGVGISAMTMLVAVLPASLYGEGLRRAYAALAGADDTLVGWRGRAPLLPLLAAHLFTQGPGGVVLGVYVALNVDWVVVSLPLAWSFRIVAPDPPPWRFALVGGFTAGAFVAGFLQGFVLFLALPLDL